MLQDEYFVIERENNDCYPLFSWDQTDSQYGRGEPVKSDKPLKFRLGEPINPGFEWVDYHKAPEPVISEKILDALLPLKLYGAEFVPAKVRNPKKKLSGEKDYWFVHVWNRIECLDREKSELELYSDGMIFGFEKLVLDEKKLAEIEPVKRLIFALEEDISVLLVHEKVKEAIESAEPKGVRFFKAEEWYSDIVFDD